MHQLTADDQRRLVQYGVGAVVDLRAPSEVERMPNAFAQSNEVTHHNFDFWGDKVDDFKSSPSSLGQAEKLADLYRVGLDTCGGIIEEILTTLANGKDHTVVFHCGAGKDRTGLVAALLLGIAGVPHETIAADFALTELYLDEPNRDHENPNPLAIPDPDSEQQQAWAVPLPVYMFSCMPQTMLLTLKYVDERYSGVEGYLRTIGLSDELINRLRAKLLV
jgi:protein-tyrosine phosphatase